MINQDTLLENHIAAEVRNRHGEKSFDQLALKLAEEAGEVVGAINKLADGRSVAADVDAEIGDVLIVLCQFAERRGCKLEDYLVQRWATVCSRERREAAGEMISTPIMEDLRARLAAQQDRIDWLEQQREIAVNDLERRTREVIGEEHIEMQGRLESALASQKARGTKLLTKIVEAKVCCALEKEKLQRDMTETLGGNTPEQPAREEAITRLSQAIHAVERVEASLSKGERDE
jgi:NTP pyrophosphatase (non-canonical NTP hydrolase)